MRLVELVTEELTRVNPTVDALNVEILGLTADSRIVEPGFLFAALAGAEADGATYIGEAVQRGAVCVLAPPGTRIAEAGQDVRLLCADNPRRQFALLAARFFAGQPATLAAVTGTNGKTSVVEFCRQIWTALGRRAASLGTLGLTAPESSVPGTLTTPDPVMLHRTLGELVQGGVDHVAIEASSHGLDQYRLDGARISIAAFTNLSRDHLDYHGTAAKYLAAKRRLFTELLAPGAIAVLNADEVCFAELAAAVRAAGRRVFGYGLKAEDLRLKALRPVATGQELTFTIKGADYAVSLPLTGGFQAMNALAALAIVIADQDDGAEIAKAVRALAGLAAIPGRMQRVATLANGGAAYVDYAHTPDALDTVLKALQRHVGEGGRLVAVFGCGGDRDPGKRRPMGDIAQAHADRVIVTDDNPRNEDAATIRRQILAGCPGCEEIADRAQAIGRAVADLRGGDILVVAGKGHESGQIVGAEILPFDDVEVTARAMREADA